MEKNLKVIVHAFWDDEARVWVAESEAQFGLATEAATLDRLQEKLPGMVSDLLPDGFQGDVEIELVTTSHQVIAAE